MKVQHADLLGVDDGPDGLQAGPVVRLLVLSVLHKPPRQDVLLELDAGDEVVVGPIRLVLAAGARGVGNGNRKARRIPHQALPQFVAANVWGTCTPTQL